MKKLRFIAVLLLIAGGLVIAAGSIGTTPYEKELTNPETFNLEFQETGRIQDQEIITYTIQYNFPKDGFLTKKITAIIYKKIDFLKCLNKGNTRTVCLLEAKNWYLAEKKKKEREIRDSLYEIKDIEDRRKLDMGELVVSTIELNN